MAVWDFPPLAFPYSQGIKEIRLVQGAVSINLVLGHGDRHDHFCPEETQATSPN